MGRRGPPTSGQLVEHRGTTLVSYYVRFQRVLCRSVDYERGRRNAEAELERLLPGTDATVVEWPTKNGWTFSVRHQQKLASGRPERAGAVRERALAELAKLRRHWDRKDGHG